MEELQEKQEESEAIIFIPTITEGGSGLDEETIIILGVVLCLCVVLFLCMARKRNNTNFKIEAVNTPVKNEGVAQVATPPVLDFRGAEKVKVAPEVDMEVETVTEIETRQRGIQQFKEAEEANKMLEEVRLRREQEEELVRAMEMEKEREVLHKLEIAKAMEPTPEEKAKQLWLDKLHKELDDELLAMRKKPLELPVVPANKMPGPPMVLQQQHAELGMNFDRAAELKEMLKRHVAEDEIADEDDDDELQKIANIGNH